MKRTSWVNKVLLASLLFVIMMGTSLFSMQDTKAAPGDQPIITILSPSANNWLKDESVIMSGTYVDENVGTKSDLLFTAYEQKDDATLDKISDSAQNSADWVLSSPNSTGNGTWKFTKTLSEGKHNIVIEIKEQAASTLSNQTKISFTVGNRPFITSEKIVLNNNDEVNGEDYTSVPTDARIKITIADNKPMDDLVGKIQSDPTYTPVKVLLNNEQISGTTTIGKTLQNGEYQYTIMFTPNKPLTLEKNYLVYADPSIVDDSGNTIFARFFKFTTMSDMDEEDNPHGNYTMITNTCANCHSSHNGSSDNLDGGKNVTTYSNQLQDPSKNYCMACHDGTLNAPMVFKADSTNHHGSSADLKQPESCTSCHNPHKGRSDDNPNMLKDHYVYTHNQVHPDQGLTTTRVDSLDTPCDTCHDDNEIVTAGNVNYEVLSYKKSDATGMIDTNLETVSDYSLCLRCHNTKNNVKDSKIADIQQYYVDSTSGHYFALPSGQTTQDDGSPLNGQIQCAECHETHGSNNLMNLREQLGNVQVSDANKFQTVGTTWNASNERKFCLSCHNNSTEVNGKVAIQKFTNAAGNPIFGHQSGDTQACSSCHGTGSTDSEKALSAAHAPKK